MAFNASDWPCSPCSAGQFARKVAACAEVCWPGLHSRLGILLSVQPGSFNSESGGMCQTCANGSVTSSYGATVCYACDAGKYSLGGSAPVDYPPTQCTSCDRGTFAASSSSIECTEAPPGYYVPDQGAKVAVKCPADTYSDTSGSVECIACEAGKTSAAGSTSCSGSSGSGSDGNPTSSPTAIDGSGGNGGGSSPNNPSPTLAPSRTGKIGGVPTQSPTNSSDAGKLSLSEDESVGATSITAIISLSLFMLCVCCCLFACCFSKRLSRFTGFFRQKKEPELTPYEAWMKIKESKSTKERGSNVTNLRNTLVMPDGTVVSRESDVQGGCHAKGRHGHV